ncbi:unnamed protein product [Bemisia tabaci]|uniref:TrmE-type G domain-containing protein n=1 Tax=Bemisia tabaci TaxID=7038 RepID=A0A9P0F649_BEMTA|nr:unnamed protein product [Bemisia tabaci]
MRTLHHFCKTFSNLAQSCHLTRHMSTIYALSSGRGKCGVAVIRVSGPKSAEVFSRMTNLKGPPPPRQAMLLSILDPETRTKLDKGLLLWFPAPSSFTGEHCCELQVHGGLAVISSVLTSLGKLDDFQPASPGEFTRRAFYANKLDLTEVEGLADLIEAETEFQRQQALYQMEGNLKQLYSCWRDTLARCLAFVEAYIDFSEDDNIEDNILQKVDADLKELSAKIQLHLLDGRKGERLRSGVMTIILGAPNVGKSSLLNALCERPAAIVTEVPGTTRDVIEATLNINGYPVLLADTAGIRRNTVDIVEKEGISRTYSSAEKSDFILFLIDARHFFDSAKSINNNISDSELSKLFQKFFRSHVSSLQLDSFFSNSKLGCDGQDGQLKQLNSTEMQLDTESLGTKYNHNSSAEHTKNYLVILNKLDLLDPKEKLFCHRLSRIDKNIVPVSCKTEENLPHLLSLMTEHLSDLCGNPSQESPVLSQVRHRYHINECHLALQMFFSNNTDETIVIGAEYLREAIRSIGRITGHVSSEELLDIIFKQFCIGK